MALFALSDLHLSLSTNKPMDIFGEGWREHHLRIQENWNIKVSEEDLVLIPGDISWGMNLEEAMEDLEFVHGLRGKKVLLKGNHDYWWSTISKLNALYDDMFFLQNTFTTYQDYAICGSRGWISIDGTEPQDEKVYRRELLRLEMSLQGAKKAGYNKIITMMHYPPITRINRSQEFLDLLHNYGVEKLIYGHVHFDARNICINGNYNGIEYYCTSADIINFDPLRIL